MSGAVVGRDKGFDPEKNLSVGSFNRDGIGWVPESTSG